MTSSVTNPTPIFNPLTGNVVLTPSVGIAGSFGFVWAVSRVPPFAGFAIGALPTYEDRVFDLVVTHTLGSGLVVVTDRFSTHESNGLFFWSHALPSNALFSVFPNFELTVEWVIGV
jgi:hypothetical protein